MSSSGAQPLEFARSLVSALGVRACTLLVLLGMLGCQGNKPKPMNLDSVIMAPSGPDREQMEKEIPEDLLRLLDLVQQLVLDHDDQAARNVLQRLNSREPKGLALEMARAFGRVLDGRELVDSLRLELVTQAHSGDPNRYRVALFAVKETPGVCTLRPGPATLTLESTVVDGNGRERRNETSRATDALTEIVLVPGEPVELALLEFAPPVGTGAVAAISEGAQSAEVEGSQSILAARYIWHLSLRAGGFEVDAVHLPAMGLEVQPAERLWISRSLPQAAVEPAEFLEFVEAKHPTQIALLDLMGLAVRIPGERRGETLELLRPKLESLGLDSLAVLAPALRWISADSRLGDDPSAWREWLGRRADSAAKKTRGSSGLDLPDPKSTTSAVDGAE